MCRSLLYTPMLVTSSCIIAKSGMRTVTFRTTRGRGGPWPTYHEDGAHIILPRIIPSKSNAEGQRISRRRKWRLLVRYLGYEHCQSKKSWKCMPGIRNRPARPGTDRSSLVCLHFVARPRCWVFRNPYWLAQFEAPPIHGSITIGFSSRA